VSPAPLPRFVLLYATLSATFGVASPFLPGLPEQRGLRPAEIGVMLAGIGIRLLAGPVGCRLADWLGASRGLLIALIAASSAFGSGCLLPGGLETLLLVVVLHALVLAPIVPLAASLRGADKLV